MQFSQSTIIALAALLSQVSAHGLLTEVQGANGVNMPALGIIDGTPRDCATPGCGSEADTSIIRNNGAPLGKTQGGGNVDAASAIAKFMGTADATPAAASTTKGTKATKAKRGLLDSLTGGGKGANSGTDATGTKTAKGTKEAGVSKAAGAGASSGLPTADANGVVTMTFHQVNQDGAGPLTAQIDPTSGGTDAAAFQDAQVMQNVPGIGIGGLSGASTMDFTVKVQMPAGMKCTGSVGGAENVCIVKMKNSAAAGPFGGSVAFTDATSGAAAAAKRSINKRSAKFRA